MISLNYYYDIVLKAAKYIEENLTNEITLEDIINYIDFSKFHFLRIFKAVSGYTINYYIRRRRMTEAAKLLTETDMRIIDIAIFYCYNSQEAFTRAFREVFNVTPNYYRSKNLFYDNLKQLPLSEEILNYKYEGEIITPVIVEKESFLLAGLEYEGSNSNYEVSKLWNKLCDNMEEMKEIIINPEICYGLELYNEATLESGCFTYIAAFEVSRYDSVPENMKTIRIPKARYAVFPIKAIIENVQRSVSKIYSMHLPQSNLKIKGDYDFEYYDNNFIPNTKEGFYYLYVPIED